MILYRLWADFIVPALTAVFAILATFLAVAFWKILIFLSICGVLGCGLVAVVIAASWWIGGLYKYLASSIERPTIPPARVVSR